AVQAVIEKLGYSPNSRARALASGRSYLIAVVQDDPNAHVIGAMQRGIVETCSQHGYELVVHPVRFSDPDIAFEIEKFVQRSRVDGLIVLPPTSEIAAIPERLSALGVPSIGIASKSPAMPWRPRSPGSRPACTPCPASKPKARSAWRRPGGRLRMPTWWGSWPASRAAGSSPRW
ncbi:MAG: hypothetical protein K6U07_08115, partial [Firmicutes bacterium]|nr:hypothetical protein [Bacillota bacterium]